MTATREEGIRRWPRWLARMANLIPGIRWTKHYCTSGCGYPVTGVCLLEIDHIDGVPIVMMVCSLGGECEYNVLDDPRDASGAHYADIRPFLVETVRQQEEKPNNLMLSFGR